MFPVPEHDVRHATLGAPLLPLSQHWAACPSDTVHCDESLQGLERGRGAHDCALAAHVKLSPMMPAQHPSPRAHRTVPHATVSRTEEASTSPASLPSEGASPCPPESGSRTRADRPSWRRSPRACSRRSQRPSTSARRPWRSLHPDTSVHPVVAASTDQSASRAKPMATRKDLTDLSSVNTRALSRRGGHDAPGPVPDGPARARHFGTAAGGDDVAPARRRGRSVARVRRTRRRGRNAVIGDVQDPGPVERLREEGAVQRRDPREGDVRLRGVDHPVPHLRTCGHHHRSRAAHEDPEGLRVRRITPRTTLPAVASAPET